MGTLNDLSGRLVGIPIRGVSTTTAWNPPLECAFASVKPSWPVRTHITETFNESGTGTRHVVRYEVIGRGAIGRLAAPLFCALMKRSRKTYQARLAIALGGAAATI